MARQSKLDWNKLSGRLTEYGGIAKANWGRLTDNDLTTIGGSRDLLIGKLQVRYGLTKDQAEQQVDDWLARLAVTGAAPVVQMAGYLSGPVYDAGNELTKAAAKSIRQHPALVFGVTAAACFALGACWQRLVR
jgi:uncharacterized protein YjbJ (UPF0337 family)